MLFEDDDEETKNATRSRAHRAAVYYSFFPLLDSADTLVIILFFFNHSNRRPINIPYNKSAHIILAITLDRRTQKKNSRAATHIGSYALHKRAMISL